MIRRSSELLVCSRKCPLYKENNMYIYTVHAMPGQKAKFNGDSSIKYQIKRVDTSLKVNQKGRSAIIRTNLEYEDAIVVIKTFIDKEGESQIRKAEAATREREQ